MFYAGFMSQLIYFPNVTCTVMSGKCYKCKWVFYYHAETSPETQQYPPPQEAAPSLGIRKKLLSIGFLHSSELGLETGECRDSSTSSAAVGDRHSGTTVGTPRALIVSPVMILRTCRRWSPPAPRRPCSPEEISVTLG